MSKNILSRIQNKHDIEANWNKATSFIPMRGELIVYDIDANYDYERLKIGDGATPVTELPFVDENVSWNDLKDKPFGESETGGDTLTWDGNTEGRISFLGSYYKISDVAPTLDDCKNGIIVNFADGSVKNVSFEDLQAMYEVTNCVTHQGFMISPNDGFTLEGMTAAEKGLYVLSHVASITIPGYNGFPSIKIIDPKYLPANVATQEYVDNAIVQSDWNQNDEVAADFIKNKPSLVGKNVGGTSQNVDGTYVTAGSNAEIFNNYASNRATGEYSHAEGGSTTASGMCAHAEGTGTKANAPYSHAEGVNTITNGGSSHAEGTGTITSGPDQHAQGKYNISNGALAHIVGNGTADNARSNAHTLDWNGNAWYKGDVYVGSTSGTDKDNGSKKLATEEYVDEVISSTADEIKNDLLNSKADTIQKKSGNIIITDNSAYTPVKGLKLYGKTIQNGTPAPDAPAPLESVGADGSLAVTVCGKNLLDVSSYPLTAGGYINYQSGDRIVDGDPVQKSTEDFIPVEHLQGKTIAMNFNASFAVPGVAFYTEPVKGAYISGCKPGVITVPDNARFMRITADSVYENLQIEIGSISTEYEPYKSQTLTAQTPNGLPGIPVSSSGNYTDESGQQWVCDEIDFARGKYVQRIKTLVLNGSENWSLNPSMNAPFITGASGIANCTQNEIRLLCDSYQPVPESASWKAYDTMVSRANATAPTLYFRNVNYTTLDAFKASLADSPIKLQYILAESIETDLTAEQIAQYSALHTNYPNTTIYNDKDASMELTYYTPTTAVQMVHSPADKGKILSIDQHGCVILKKIETEITWGSW